MDNIIHIQNHITTSNDNFNITNRIPNKRAKNKTNGHHRRTNENKMETQRISNKDAWKLQYLMTIIYAGLLTTLIFKEWTGGAFLFGITGGIAYVILTILLWAQHLGYMDDL
jgi:hypothetical protein